jgi:hypothetical protein
MDIVMDSSAEPSERRIRRPGGTRALDVVLRTVHVGVSGILLGGVAFAVPFPRLVPWHHLVVASGGALIASEIYHHSRHWPYQGRGVMALTHVGLLGLVHLRPDWKVAILSAVLVVGMVGSHMTKNLRYWSIVHGRVVQ